MNAKNFGRRFAAAAVASAVSILTFAVVAQAAQTISVPNAISTTYNLAANGNAVIPLPSNVPVLVMGTQATSGFRGVGQVTLHSIPGVGGFIQWVGLESNTGAAITEGFSGVAGTHIVFLDFSHQVDLEVNTIGAANTMRVHNGSAGVRSGRVTMIW